MPRKKVMYNKDMDSKTKNIFMLGLLLIAIIAISILTVQLARFVSEEKQDLGGEAAIETKEVTLLLFPSDVKQSVGTTFIISSKAVGPADKRMASVAFSIFFDREHLEFKNLVENGSADKIVLLKSSTIEEAKSSGEVKVLMGAISYENAPAGAINLTRLVFEIKKEGRSEIKFEASASQIVFINHEVADLKLGGNVVVNSIVATEVEPSPTVQEIEPSPTLVESTEVTPTAAPTAPESQ